MLVMISQDMTDVLAEKALNALAKFLDAFNIFLIHVPRTIFVVGFAGLELFDLLLDPIVPRDIRDEVFHDRERLHRLDRDRFVGVQVAHPRHAHEFGPTVDFGRT